MNSRMLFRNGLLSAGLVVLLFSAPPALACPDESDRPPELTVDSARAALVCLMNERRKHAGVPKLRTDSRLTVAAQTHSDSMDSDNFFAHDNPGGGGPLDRVRNSGYLAGAKAWGVGENIRWGSDGQSAPRSAIRAWMKSPGHRQAMLDRRYRHVGVGVAIGSPAGPDANGAIYTADFGYRR